MYVLKNDGTPITRQEKLELYPDGTCPLCRGNYGWTGSMKVEEGDEPIYIVQCDGCNAEYPEGY